MNKIIEKVYNWYKEHILGNIDKVYHFLVCFFLVIVGGAILTLCKFCAPPLEASFILVVILGIFKEIFDKATHGIASIKDVVADIFGAVSALVAMAVLLV